MRTAIWDSNDPDMHYGNPNLRWGSPSYLLEPGDPGYVPPSPPPTPTTHKHMKKPHCPVPTIIFNGNLIAASAQKYPKVSARLPQGYLTETATVLGKLPADIIGQKTAHGETGNLTLEQQQTFDTLLHCMGQVRKTARLAFPGQTVKLHDEFQIGFHESDELPAVLSRADILLASVQIPANLAALKLKGWTDADTTTFTTTRGKFPASATAQKSGQSDAKKATGAKDIDAATAYEHIITIQNAADLEYPATDTANAPVRAEFRLGLFPPDHHVPPAAPTPPPPATPKP